MKHAKQLLVYTVICAMVAAMADHTPAETNSVVSAMLSRVRIFCSIDNLGKDMALWQRLCPGTWEKFLGTDDASWTLEERKGAFDWYLSTLGSANLQKRSAKEQDDVLCAISECALLKYTNAVHSLFALALNTNGVHREDAVRTALKIGSINDDATSFVEYLTTNHANVAELPRGVALGEYGVKLLSGQATNSVAVTRAVEMFYRNRKSEIAVAHGCDMVLTNFINSYVISSNRLDVALWALEDQEFTTGRYRDYFIAVTNQLFSSSPSLQWINVGGTNE